MPWGIRENGVENKTTALLPVRGVMALWSEYQYRYTRRRKRFVSHSTSFRTTGRNCNNKVAFIYWGCCCLLCCNLTLTIINKIRVLYQITGVLVLVFVLYFLLLSCANTLYRMHLHHPAQGLQVFIVVLQHAGPLSLKLRRCFPRLLLILPLRRTCLWEMGRK